MQVRLVGYHGLEWFLVVSFASDVWGSVKVIVGIARDLLGACSLLVNLVVVLKEDPRL